MECFEDALMEIHGVDFVVIDGYEATVIKSLYLPNWGRIIENVIWCSIFFLNPDGGAIETSTKGKNIGKLITHKFDAIEPEYPHKKPEIISGFFISTFSFEKEKAVKAPANIRSKTIQKSPGMPTTGSQAVFMLKRVAKNIAGKVTKAITVKVFIISLVLLESRESLVSLKSPMVSLELSNRFSTLANSASMLFK